MHRRTCWSPWYEGCAGDRHRYGASKLLSSRCRKEAERWFFTRSDVHPHNSVRMTMATLGERRSVCRSEGDGDTVRRPLEQGLSARDWLSVTGAGITMGGASWTCEVICVGTCSSTSERSCSRGSSSACFVNSNRTGLKFMQKVEIMQVWAEVLLS